MDWMSEISLLRSPCALVTMRFVTPRFAASSRIDCVSAVRNGFASFSDCAKPILAPFKSSTFATPSPAYLSDVQRSPDSDWTFWEASAPAAAFSSSAFPQAATTSARPDRTTAAPREANMCTTPLPLLRCGRGAPSSASP